MQKWTYGDRDCGFFRWRCGSAGPSTLADDMIPNGYVGNSKRERPAFRRNPIGNQEMRVANQNEVNGYQKTFFQLNPGIQVIDLRMLIRARWNPK
jgi:hypothetical protein